jgi:IclR family pca regulon transcriptional regulator
MPTLKHTPKPTGHFSESLARGLSVIQAFDRDAPMLRIADVAKRTGLDRAAARRFLLTLLDLGYVGRSDDLFYLRPRTLDIGFSYLASLDLDRVIQPFLNELTEATRETSSFGIADGFDVRLLARSANNRMLNVSVALGSRVPAYSASLGRVLLAGLSPEQFKHYLEALPTGSVAPEALDRDALRASVEQTRSCGWVTVEPGPGRGFRSIAVPIRDSSGAVVAGVNVLEYPPRNSAPTMVRKYLPILRNAATQIEAAMRLAQHSVATWNTATHDSAPPSG